MWDGLAAGRQFQSETLMVALPVNTATLFTKLRIPWVSFMSTVDRTVISTFKFSGATLKAVRFEAGKVLNTLIYHFPRCFVTKFLISHQGCCFGEHYSQGDVQVIFSAWYKGNSVLVLLVELRPFNRWSWLCTVLEY